MKPEANTASRELTISLGNSRRSKSWKSAARTWKDLVQKLSETEKTVETIEEYAKMSKYEKGDIKDIGGYVGGPIKGGRRIRTNVVWRDLLTLDIDYYVEGTLEKIIGMGYECVIHSTHSDTPEKRRFRIIMPLSHPVKPHCEFQAISRKMTELIGIENFDNSTHEPHRLMYWPSTCDDGDYYYKHVEGAWIVPEDIMGLYKDWRDIGSWPRSHRDKENLDKEITRKQQDPFLKKGIIGAFCRTYSIHDCTALFMNENYAPVDNEPNRYTFVGGSTYNGVEVFDKGKFSYSYHDTDPASHILVNAFDLVRIHRFGHLDAEVTILTETRKLPSYAAMQDFATTDDKVKETISLERIEECKIDFIDQDWVTKLEYQHNGTLKPSMKNLILILSNDPDLQSVLYNQFIQSIYIHGDLPWRKDINGRWNDVDDSNLRCHLDVGYRIWSPPKVRDALVHVASLKSFHPIQDYLNGLEWDGIDRIDTLLIDLFQSDDNIYTREAMRKTLVAAVTRVFQPGTKFDIVLTIAGDTGIGKSTLFSKLGMDWFTDSMTLVDMHSKDGPEKILGNWIVELGELSGMRKADLDLVKVFLSKQSDLYRAAYGRFACDQPRQCIFVGTTNDVDAGYLRDTTGNRRFWPIEVRRKKGQKGRASWNLTQHEVDQIWAEAMYYYGEDESLQLSREAEEIADQMRMNAMEKDDREGLIQEYIDRLLPEDWEEKSVIDRRRWLESEEVGTIERRRVSSMEIWAECYGRDPVDIKRFDSIDINGILSKLLRGWKRTTARKIKPYGNQRCFERRDICAIEKREFAENHICEYQEGDGIGETEGTGYCNCLG